jgi:putative phage-type endonuclease
MSEISEHNETVSLPFSDNEYDELTETINEMMKEHITEYVLNMSKTDYMSSIVDDITHVLYQPFEDSQILSIGEYEPFRDFVDSIANEWFDNNMDYCPHRTNCHTLSNTLIHSFGLNEEFANNYISDKLKIIYEKDASNPAQRTPEWYLHRYNMLTASNLYKALGSDSNKNSLIYEKCKPLETEYTESKWISTEGSLHWGVKYEPLTVLLYEHLTGAKVGHFGCIVHPEYNFLGASPDGIVINPESPLYGRLVEIKNIYNRDMDGIPSEAYWVQTQIQMQCCDLPDCDFVETRFKEYESKEAFLSEEDPDKKRGIILHFIKRDSTSNIPHYEYSPPSLSIDQLDEWVESTTSNIDPQLILFKTHYWNLDEICISTIYRNDAWFQGALPHFKEIWETIQRERVEGYEHRSSKKRAASIDLSDLSKGSITVIKEPIANCYIRLTDEDRTEE